MVIEDQNSHHVKLEADLTTNGSLDKEKMWEFFREYQVKRDEFLAVWGGFGSGKGKDDL